MKRIILTAIVLAITLGIRAQSNATQIEYFLDADNGFGQNTVLDIASPDIDITETVLADIPSGTSVGYHKLYMRVKDADGNWSQTIRKHIEIVAPFVENNIVMGEYFIDEDYQYGTGTSFTIDPETDDIQQAFSAQIAANTPLGYHKLYGRVKDAYGNWSHTFRKNIEVYQNPNTNLVEIEYFFGDDLEFGNNTVVEITEPETDGTYTFNVPYPTGNYSFEDVLYVRVKDSNQNWSITTTLDEIATLEVNDFLIKSTLLYPNPFNEQLNIKLPNNVTILKTEIHNSLGQTVYSSTENKTTLKVEHLKSGLYFLNLKTDMGGTASFKVIKQ